MSSKLIDKPMGNAEVAAILGQAQKFWIKWRDQVKDKQFDAWEDVIKDAGAILESHGTRLVRKWEGPAPAIEEEPVAAPIVNWFLDQLEDRNREAVGK